MHAKHNPKATKGQGPLDRPMTVTVFPDQYASTKTEMELSPAKLAEWITRQRAAEKTKLPYIKLATFGTKRRPGKDGKGRCLRWNENVESVNGVEVDYDGGTIPPEVMAASMKAAGVAGVVATTPSHGQPGKGHRWRVYAPFSEPLPPAAREEYVAKLNGVADGALAEESFTLSQSFYAGNMDGGSPVQTWLVDGQPIDRVENLKPIYKDGSAYKRPSEPGQGEPTGLPFRVIRDALMACPNAGDAYASRDAWMHMVMAVHCETEGSEEGRELVHKWSKQHRDFYDASNTDALWDSCKADRGLTGWHVIREAERHGWHDDAVTELRHMDALEDFDDLYQLMGWLPPEEEAEIAELVGGPVDRSGGLTFLSPSDCAATAARPYVIKGLLAQGDVAAIVGAPGAGKSLFAPRLGYAVAQGAEVFGRRVKAGGVFYVAAEDGHGMRGRVQAMEAEHGDAPDFKVVEGVSDLLSKQGQIKALQRAVKERRPALVVIDTLAVAFPGLEENDAKGMGQVVAAARSLTKWGAAVVLIHHDTKAGDGLPRGHSLLNGALDVALYLKREDGVVSVKPSKNRNGTTEQELAFTVGVREIGTDEDGDAITAAICEEADNASRARGPKLSPSVQAALSVLRDLGKGTMHVPEEAWRDACVEGRAVSGSDNVESRRKAFKRAVEDLTRKGVVILAEGKFVERYRDNEQFTEDFDDV